MKLMDIDVSGFARYKDLELPNKESGDGFTVPVIFCS
jgi:hypothetical protein